MLAKDTICAEMAFMLMERNREGSTIDYPMGGTSSIVDALRRGIEKHGGKVMLRSHVEEILVEGGCQSEGGWIRRALGWGQGMGWVGQGVRWVGQGVGGWTVYASKSQCCTQNKQTQAQ